MRTAESPSLLDYENVTTNGKTTKRLISKSLQVAMGYHSDASWWSLRQYRAVGAEEGADYFPCDARKKRGKRDNRGRATMTIETGLKIAKLRKRSPGVVAELEKMLAANNSEQQVAAVAAATEPAAVQPVEVATVTSAAVETSTLVAAPVADVATAAEAPVLKYIFGSAAPAADWTPTAKQINACVAAMMTSAVRMAKESDRSHSLPLGRLFTDNDITSLDWLNSENIALRSDLQRSKEDVDLLIARVAELQRQLTDRESQLANAMQSVLFVERIAKTAIGTRSIAAVGDILGVREGGWFLWLLDNSFIKHSDKNDAAKWAVCNDKTLGGVLVMAGNQDYVRVSNGQEKGAKTNPRIYVSALPVLFDMLLWTYDNAREQYVGKDRNLWGPNWQDRPKPLFREELVRLAKEQATLDESTTVEDQLRSFQDESPAQCQPTLPSCQTSPAGLPASLPATLSDYQRQPSAIRQQLLPWQIQPQATPAG